jgi:hypothetical protein
VSASEAIVEFYRVGNWDNADCHTIDPTSAYIRKLHNRMQMPRVHLFGNAGSSSGHDGARLELGRQSDGDTQQHAAEGSLQPLAWNFTANGIVLR